MNPLALATPIILARGWRRVVIAFLAGAGSTLALAPIDVWPAMFVTFSVLVWLLDGTSEAGWRGIRSAFAIGWWFGFGYFLAGLYWVGFAFLVDARTFGWLLPFAVTLLPAGLAVFTGLGIAAARALWVPGPLRIVTLAATLSSAEWLRGHVLTGFPWNVFGYALTAALPLAQSVALFGIWGLTFVAIAVFASPAVLADRRAVTRWPWMPVALAGLALCAMAVFGVIRLAGMPAGMVDGVHLRIMQPNIPQDEKFNYGSKDRILDFYIALSKRQVGEAEVRGATERDPAGGLSGVTHLIWPESAFPFFLNTEPAALVAIGRMLTPQTTLITGAATRAPPLPGRAGLRAYNSVLVIDHNGAIVAGYDKLHLVPFGEYLPFQDFLESLGLLQLTKLRGGFESGDRRRKMVIPGAPDLLPLVCYEVIFPAEAVPTGERPGWLLNLTNDAWFGISAGPYQHFRQARIRAIEEGLPLVRAANDGISAVIDPMGRIVAALPLGSEGVLDSGLPLPIGPTAYAMIRDALFFLVIAAAMILAGWGRLRLYLNDKRLKGSSSVSGLGCFGRIGSSTFIFRRGPVCGLGR